MAQPQFQIVGHYIEDRDTALNARIQRYEQRIQDLEKENEALKQQIKILEKKR